jgi:high-affinity iron transporter
MATRLATSPLATLVGAILGLVTAIALGLLVFSSTRRLNLRQFFIVTNVLLLLFAAGLVAHGVHELNEAGWIPSIIEPVWDVNHIQRCLPTLDIS